MGGDSELVRLRAERDHARSILEAVSAGYVVSIGGRIIDVNDAFCAMIGFARDELVGAEMPWPFWPPEALEVSMEIKELVTSELHREFSGPVEIPLMRKNGQRFIGEVQTMPALNADGSLFGWVGTFHDIANRHDYEVELERLATHDPLTGLANRRLFEQRLDAEMSDAVRYGRSLAVAILDMDEFKSVNDRFGHPVGDRVLMEVSQRLGGAMRRGDLIARVGGEEFAWILPEVHSHGAWAAVERARRSISEVPFDGVGELTISIGVGMRGRLERCDVLYEQADQSLYRAKHQGRNRSVLWRADATNDVHAEPLD